MPIQTHLTKALGIQHPIICAAMMWVGKAEICAAASEAGALGLITGLSPGSPEALRAEIRKVKQLTKKPFGVNLTFLPSLTPPPYEEYAKVMVEEGVKVAETAGGPAAGPIIQYLKSHGLYCIHKCTTIRHAKKAISLGVDLLSIDGFECAGHPGENPQGNLILLALAAKELNGFPYIASGGIADGRGLAAALSLGAVGVNCGTAFMCTVESYIHQNVKNAMVAASEESTTHIFKTLGNTARVFKNKIAVDVVQRENRPGGVDFAELAPLVSGARGKTVYETGDVDAGIWSASPAMGLIDSIPTCKQLVEKMVGDAEDILLAGAKLVVSKESTARVHTSARL